MKTEIMKKIRNTPIETALIFTAICISLIGFATTVLGAFLNGLMMFNGQKDLSAGFGIVLMGNSVAFVGVVIVILALITYIFKEYFHKTENCT